MRVEAIGFTGSIAPVVDQQPGRPGILWTSSVSFDYTPMGPNAAQRARGQHWSACVVGTKNATPYVGRLHGVLSDGELPSVFGSCWPSVSLRVAQQTPCGQPHPIELLGSTIVAGTPIAASDVRAACTAYADRVLRSADATRGGVIAIEIVGFDRDLSTAPNSDAYLQDSNVACLVRAPAGRQFTGTLIGVGERPLPLR